jgi:long-chain acyl-CoA synthetase
VRRAFSRLAKIVPTDQHQGVLSSLAFGSAVLQRGHILVWFPEGRRSPTGELLPLRAGIGLLLAHHDQAVILPTFIAGSDEALPPGERVPSRVPITVTFGEATTGAALEETGAGDEPHERITAALEERLRALASSVNAATANEGQGEAR